MKLVLDYIRVFPFKNFLAIPLIAGLLYLMVHVPSLHDSTVVLLTLIVKYYYDSTTNSSAKDATISRALDQAQQLPAVGTAASPTVQNASNVTIDQSK